MAANSHIKPQKEEKHAPPEPPGPEAKYQAHVPAEIRNVSFPLGVPSSTESDRIKAESDERIAQAKAQAERIVAEGKANADQHRREVEEELAKLRSEAEAKMKELEADTATLWDRRHELLGDIDRMADRLHEAARDAAGRLARVGS